LGYAIPAVASSGAAESLETAALLLDRNLQERHWPHHSILDPVFASTDSEEVVAYTRAPDSAMWTGHYLAAEAYRYKVTGDAGALENIARALAAIRLLIDVTATDLLARAALAPNSPFCNSIVREERPLTFYPARLENQDYVWLGQTTPDQYCGVFFGLACAFDLVNEATVRAAATVLVTRLLDFLLEHHWNIVMPGGPISGVFLNRADQQLTLLQIGRRLNPARFEAEYKTHRISLSASVEIPIAYDCLDDHHSYAKFNLAAINLFHLVRFEDGPRLRAKYLAAYKAFRRAVRTHGNAHFNMIDRFLSGPDEARDHETHALLRAWLRRPRRDSHADLRSVYPAAQGPDRAPAVIPVDHRVPADFLWQHSPFLLYGGGEGRIETAGIDFLLPYWMARSTFLSAGL